MSRCLLAHCRTANLRGSIYTSLLFTILPSLYPQTVGYKPQAAQASGWQEPNIPVAKLPSTQSCIFKPSLTPPKPKHQDTCHPIGQASEWWWERHFAVSLWITCPTALGPKLANEKVHAAMPVTATWVEASFSISFSEFHVHTFKMSICAARNATGRRSITLNGVQPKLHPKNYKMYSGIHLLGKMSSYVSTSY